MIILSLACRMGLAISLVASQKEKVSIVAYFGKLCEGNLVKGILKDKQCSFLIELLTLVLVFACHLFERGDGVGYAQSTLRPN